MPIYLLVIMLLGLCVGSFINAWVYRTYLHKTIVQGRSECPRCRHQLAAKDLVPVLSYIWLRGKCRYCGKKISPAYPLVETATAVLYGGLYWYWRPESLAGQVGLVVWLIVSVLLVAGFVYDMRYMILPDRYMLPAIIVGLFYVFFLSTKVGHFELWRLAAAAGFAGFYGLLWLISKGKWIGDGDIRLAAVIGLILSPAQLAVGVFAAYVIGSVVGVYLIVVKKHQRGHAIPFGPFLIAGAYFGLFWGSTIANWYFGLIH